MLAGNMQRAILMAIFLFATFSLAAPADESKAEGTELGQLSNEANPAGSGSGAPQRVFDFKITPDMKTEDLDNPKSALSKLISFIVKGASKASRYVAIVGPKTPTPEIKLRILDNSIFVPGGGPPQLGFRRTDVNPAIDKTTTLSGITTWYQTIRLASDAPLSLEHGYLLASIEGPTGKTTHQSAIYSSTGTDPLKMASGPMANDPKAMSPDVRQKGEYHIQLIKFPLADKKTPADKVGDVPHFGFQPPIKREHVFFSNVFVTSGKEIEQPKFTAPKTKKVKACKRT
ncbi:hypothetical protein PtA15_14A352 [Puccinia triticina]|uniref:Glycoside hydrolase 131 catalytic N-terminal domain-containing protein n=1 Tax=Puccinia triticina TaxID=208348 RepID=A0ABY7D4E4_9BASI|nr:uncharacterized protein PtA15_14A352 [Puccinia triticina]WAQ91468.1 hypothetical protein PtA15_14A352 [Puccinia triticina]